MGWWSTDIMGGDQPLDYEDAYFDICDVEKFPSSGGKATLTKEVIEKNLEKILDYLSKETYDQNIGYQVLAVLMMKAGAKINDSLKSDMLAACEEDEWAMEDEERRESVQGLIRALFVYDNINPIKIKSKGLFEVFNQHMTEGKSGLINKNIQS